MTREPSQTAEEPTVCTGRLVPTIISWLAGSGLEAKEECYIPSAPSISFREKVDGRLRTMLNCPPSKEMKGIDQNSLMWRIFMTSSVHSDLSWDKVLLKSAHSKKCKS